MHKLESKMREEMGRDVPDNYEQSVIVSCDDVFDLSSALENGSSAFEGERESIKNRSKKESEKRRGLELSGRKEMTYSSCKI